MKGGVWHIGGAFLHLHLHPFFFLSLGLDFSRFQNDQSSLLQNGLLCESKIKFSKFLLGIVNVPIKGEIVKPCVVIVLL